MSEITIKDVQHEILKIFKEVSKILEDNNLRYFAIGGTCLGAVRHNGFIPWDDDLDIAMPDVDYEKFIKIAPNVLPSHLKMILPSDSEHYLNFTLRITNESTTFIEDQIIMFEDRFMGVWIDIMPLVGIPNDKKSQQRFIKKVERYKRMNVKKRMPLSYNKSLLSFLHHIVSFPLNFFLPKDYWYKKWIKLVSRNRFDDSEFTGYSWWYSVKKYVFPVYWFSDYTIISFEDTTIKCPVHYHLMLEQMFGDYMELPPVDKRINHCNGASIIDLNRSYKNYKKGGLLKDE